MSLDKTSHPGKPGTDELIRSGYALRVGEVDALVVSDGTPDCPPAKRTGTTVDFSSSRKEIDNSVGAAI